MKLSLKAADRGAWSNMPAREVELDKQSILCHDVILPEEFNPHSIKLWVIGHEFGAICAVWASEHELLDIAVDENQMDSFLAEEDHKECEALHTEACKNVCRHSCDHAMLGNASEPFDLTNCWYQEVDLNPATQWKLLVQFAEARGAASDNLYR